MGIIPLSFKPGEDVDTLGLTGYERYTIDIPTKISEIRPGPLWYRGTCPILWLDYWSSMGYRKMNGVGDGRIIFLGFTLDPLCSVFEFDTIAFAGGVGIFWSWWHSSICYPKP